MSLRATASQTVGPFFGIGLTWLHASELGDEDVRGERIAVQGRVLDGDGQPVPDAVLELWQADAHGRYPHPHPHPHPQPETGGGAAAGLRGFARVPTDAQGVFRFSTSLPGRVPGPGDALQAPHVSVLIFMRGLLKPVHTRMYFPSDMPASAPAALPANDVDPVLALVPPARRATLVAKRVGPAALEWDVRLQGDLETVCFEL